MISAVHAVTVSTDFSSSDRTAHEHRLAKKFFHFYGLTIEVSSDSPELVEEVRRHFAYFAVAGTPGDVKIEMHLAEPPYAGLPPLRASVITPRNICFQNDRISYIDYFGQGLAIFDREKKTCVIYGKESDLVHEIAYLFILSTVGQYLDTRKLHRVHSLGVSYNDKGILLLLPSGGGKSTLALELMRRPGFFLLGEDTPLIDSSARVLPFPLRLGVRPEEDPEIPAQYLRTVSRMEFDPKTLIDIEYFGDRLGKPVQAGLILVGERNLGEVSEIVPLGKAGAFKATIKYVIVGLGVYQGLEFLLERGLSELLGKSGVFASRFYNSLILVARTPAYRFVMGRNIEKNTETFVQFIQRKYG